MNANNRPLQPFPLTTFTPRRILALIRRAKTARIMIDATGRIGSRMRPVEITREEAIRVVKQLDKEERVHAFFQVDTIFFVPDYANSEHGASSCTYRLSF